MCVKIRLFNYIQIRLRTRLKCSQITFNNDASTHVCSNIIASVRAVPPRGHDSCQNEIETGQTVFLIQVLERPWYWFRR